MGEAEVGPLQGTRLCMVARYWKGAKRVAQDDERQGLETGIEEVTRRARWRWSEAKGQAVRNLWVRMTFWSVHERCRVIT